MLSALHSTSAFPKVVKKRPLSERLEKSFGSFLLLSLALVVFLAYLFLSYSNENATPGYDLYMLQAERTEVLSRNEILHMQIAEQQSLNQLEKDAETLGMVKAEEPLYIRGDTAVASR